MTTIYALTIDGVPFYVGITARTVEQRFTEHVNSARTGTSLKDRLIARALADGLAVDVDVLETTPRYTNQEQLHIERLVRQGYELVNAKGGDSTVYKSTEQRKELSYSIKQRRAKLRRRSRNQTRQLNVQAAIEVCSWDA